MPDPAPAALQILTSPGWSDYALLDSGNGQKLERYGSHVFIRPEAQAVWPRHWDEAAWRQAEAVFQPAAEESGGHWIFQHGEPPPWEMDYKGLRFQAQTTAGRHLGVFPEQAAQWDWLEERLYLRQGGPPPQVLNLFGYTGLATLAAARAGAEVAHVDASKKAIGWARQNQALSGLDDRPVRWILDDAYKFVLREGRRGRRYTGLLLDPPKFGRGPKGEVWEFFDWLPRLLAACRAVLEPQPDFVILTAYAIRASALSLYNALGEMMAGFGGNLEAGELALEEQGGGRRISLAIYARWQRSNPAIEIATPA